MSIATASDILGDFPFALCREVDPEVFFPEKGGDGGKVAKKLCHKCEHEAPCLEAALAEPRCWGIRGGKSERERQRIRVMRKKAAA